MTPEDCRLLFEFNSWANGLALDACAALQPGQLAEDLHSSFPSVLKTLAHIVGAEWIWNERWHGRSPSGFPSWAGEEDFAGLRSRFAALDGELIEFVSSLKAADLGRTLEYGTMSGKRFAHPLWQSIQHLANHASYHRGQIATMLRQLGARPAHTDLIAFYREREKRASA
ncbi:MAG TPA: DinB family protein [Patescibacteria group bacterium]|nr:DinB family protein [Patescibacteria group bacterium]